MLPNKQKNKNVLEIIKELLLPVIMVSLTSIIGIFLFNRLAKLEEILVDVRERVACLETSMAGVSVTLGEIKVTAINDNISLLLLKKDVEALEKKVYDNK